GQSRHGLYRAASVGTAFEYFPIANPPGPWRAQSWRLTSPPHSAGAYPTTTGRTPQQRMTYRHHALPPPQPVGWFAQPQRFPAASTTAVRPACPTPTVRGREHTAAS